MSTTNERLGQQATEVKENLQQMGGILRDAAEEQIGQLRTNVSEHCQQGREQMCSLERTVEQYLRQRPFTSVLVAAGVGLLLGRFWMRR